MGNCNFKTEKVETENISLMNKNMFLMHFIIGRGGFGKVWRVEYKKTKEIFAMKVMSKFKVHQKKSITSVMNEKKLLENLNHPFIVNMHYAFHDKECLYLILDYLGGGDLRYHLIKNHRFSEEKTKFIVASILVALEYIHTKNILHRDIKPENLVFDENGYLKLTDFGISRIWSPKNENDTSGTPGYMAPEVMMKLGHGLACDLFAVGVIAYECMLGKRPYVGANRKEIRDSIMAKQAKMTDFETPEGWSEESVDFINGLLIRKQHQRLGHERPGSTKCHPWFNGFDWTAFENFTMPSPFSGIKLSDYDQNQINKKTVNDDSQDEKNIFFRNQQIQKLFEGYFYDRENKKPAKSDLQRTSVEFNQNELNQFGQSDKTTKFTTLATSAKNI